VNIKATAGEPSSKRALQSASEKAVALSTSARLLLEASPSVFGPQPVSKTSDDKRATVAWLNKVRAFMEDLGKSVLSELGQCDVAMQRMRRWCESEQGYVGRFNQAISSS
jgi:hypothetical protein